MADLPLPSLQNNSTTAVTSDATGEVALDSLPLYRITIILWYVCSPLIILLGTFGNVMTIVIMHRMMSAESSVNLYFTGIAIMDLLVLYVASLGEWISSVFGFQVYTVNSVICKLFFWVQTGSGTISCWFLVCLTLHRAMSVVWPHRVNLLCTRRTVLVMLTVITVFFALLYSHYLFGFELVSSDDGITHSCLMVSEDYLEFVEGVFTYLELSLYSLLPFACLVFGNGILVWKLTISVKDARNKLNQGSSEHVLIREKAANSVTLTVIVVSITFILLTLPTSINYILSYFARAFNEVKGHEYAKVNLFYTVGYLLADCNSAVNFYLYCLTGRRFRKEFLKMISCCRPTPLVRTSVAVDNSSEKSPHQSHLTLYSEKRS